MKTFTLFIFSTLFWLNSGAQSRVQPAKGKPETPVKQAASKARTGPRTETPSATSTKPLTIKEKIEQRLKDSADLNADGNTTSQSSTVVNGIRIPAPGTTPGIAANQSSASNTNQTNTNQTNTNQTNTNQTNTNQTNTNQTNTNQTNINQAGTNQPNINQTNTNQTNTNQTNINQAGTNQPNINQAGTNPINTNQTNSNQVNTNQTNPNQSNSNQNAVQSTYTNAPVLTGTTLPATSAGVNGSTTGNRPVSGEQSQYNTSDLNRNQMNAINQNQNASSPQNNTATILNQNTVGNNQWGQNQVGENQWAPPPAIIRSGFGRDFPAIQNATWSTDASKNYIARYKVGDWWTTTSYNTAGIRLETRTEFPVSAQYPSPVIMYRERVNTPLEFSRISRIERQGKNTLFELRLNNGRVVYVNNDGVEVPFEQ
ncbi:hypothetical protein [Segetibacter sp. 3557_3]|uniref:hypothetical protein n=1 Tax=Segetibacter sp. 3557_3 TaxID=2547429 RepID=UPI001A9ED6DE|nr:hypothetical protein [Segetibacter sp. 3557_3]